VTTALVRIDMTDDPAAGYCDVCAEDAMESGLFSEIDVE